MLTEAQLGSHEQGKIAQRIARSTTDQNTSQKDPVENHLYHKLIIKTPYLLEENEANCIAQLYLEHVGGVLTSFDAEGFPSFPPGSLTRIGKRFNGIEDGGKAPEDGVAFWQEVRKNIPDLLTEEELQWLTDNDPKGHGAFRLLTGIAFEGKSLLAMDAVGAIVDWK